MLRLMQNNMLLKKHFRQISLSVFQPFSLICSPLLSMLCGRNKWIIKYLIVIFLSFRNAGLKKTLRLDAHHVCWRNWDLVTTSFRIIHTVNPSLSPEQTLVQSISLSFLLPHPYVSFPSLSFSLSLCCSLSRQSLVWTDKGQLSTTQPNGTITPPSFLPPQPASSNICCFLSQYRTNEWTDVYGERNQTDVDANLTWLRVPLWFQRWDVWSMSLSVL